MYEQSKFDSVTVFTLLALQTKTYTCANSVDPEDPSHQDIQFAILFLAHLSQRLKVSFCDRSSSVVRRPWCVVRLSTIYLKDISS